MYRDGEFAVYERVTDATAELRLNLHSHCDRIESGFELKSLNLPSGKSNVEAVFAIIAKHSSTHYFLSASDSECR